MLRHWTAPQSQWSSHGARKPYRSQKAPAAKYRKIACDDAGPCLGHGGAAQRDRNLAQALRFIGFGLESHNDDAGSPIAVLAWTAIERLSTLRQIWKSMIKASAGA
jgi:hypothetical protein